MSSVAARSPTTDPASWSPTPSSAWPIGASCCGPSSVPWRRPWLETCASYRRRRRPSRWLTPVAGSIRTALRRARSARSGSRVERGISYHGIALNVTTDLADFELIDPCGMPGVVVTSIAAEAGWRRRITDHGQRREAADRFAGAFIRTLGTAGDGAPLIAVPALTGR